MAVEEIYLTEMSLKELSEGKIICDGGVVIHPPKTDELGIMRIPEKYKIDGKITDEKVIAYMRARNAMHDYITVLVVKEKVIDTPEELAMRLTLLLKDAILSWRDLNE
jgi:hypothetical protein